MAVLVIIVSEPRDAGLFKFALYFMILSVPLALSLVHPFHFLRRLLPVLPFIVAAAAFYPLSVFLTDRELYTAESSALLNAALVIFLKAFASVLILILLSSTEKLHILLAGMRRLHFPKLVLTIAALLYRYVFIISDELTRTSRARESRSPGKLRSGRFRVTGNQVAVIFIRSWERSEAVYNSMLSRGFSGEFPLVQSGKIRPAEIFFAVLFVVAILSARLWEHLN